MAEMEPKTTRPGARRKPKSRHGCRTCKTRRVKCDETRPECRRCLNFGFPCDGYPVGSGDIASKRTLRPRQSLQNTRTVVQRPRFAAVSSGGPTFSDELERQYFAVFESSAAPDLCGYFDSDVWNRLILQVCHREPYVRESVIALGALHRSLSLRSAGNQHYTRSLQHYGKALRLMQELSSRNDDNRLQNTLISTLLVTCFESFIGNQDDALCHSHAGVDALAEWLEGYHRQTQYGKAWMYPTATSFVDSDLLGMFARLDIQIMLFKDIHYIRHPKLRGASAMYPNMPNRFHSVKEARLLWDIFVQQASHWRLTFPQESFSSIDFGENKPAAVAAEGAPLAEKFQAETILYNTTMQAWHTAFLPLFEETRKHPGTKEFLGASVLMLKYLGTTFAVASAFAGNETAADVFYEEYIHAVRLARDVLQSDGSEHTPGRAIFVFDENIVCALYMVAIRCRDYMIRRQAIALLTTYPRREGLWDSSMAAKIAIYIMEKEEEGMVDGFVPESARLSIVKNGFVLTQRKAVIRCSKLLEGSKKRELLPEVTLTW